MGMYNTKQVIVMRTDLNMRKGKMIAQGAHASMAWLTRRLAACNVYDELYIAEAEEEWLHSSFAKICVGVNSQKELEDIAGRAEGVGLQIHMITDNGATEFHGVPTLTCCAIGPDYSYKIDVITKNLKLL